MMNSSKVRYLIWIITALSLLSCFGCKNRASVRSGINLLPYYNEATFTPHWFSSNSAQLDTFHAVRPFQLINQEGDTITQETFAQKIYVTDFFFTTCPGICPRMTKNMNILQQTFLHDPDVLMLSHSVTPERDSVSVLKKYALKNGIFSHKWHLTTGDRQQIYHLGRASYFIEEDLGIEREIDEFLHTENFVLVDKNQHIRGIYNGLKKSSINQIIDDIKLLKKEI